MSKSTVSRVCEAIKTEFTCWAERSLADLELDYLFRDGSFFKMHDGATCRAGAGRLGPSPPPARRC